VKYRDLVKMLENDGWTEARQESSHHQYVHQTKPNTVCVAYHRLSDEVARGMLNKILKDAGLKKGK
jgi:predicted RNA binding protein YcfA (HicA-like mRNA interferase family)